MEYILMQKGVKMDETIYATGISQSEQVKSAEFKAINDRLSKNEQLMHKLQNDIQHLHTCLNTHSSQSATLSKNDRSTDISEEKAREIMLQSRQI